MQPSDPVSQSANGEISVDVAAILYDSIAGNLHQTNGTKVVQLKKPNKKEAFSFDAIKISQKDDHFFIGKLPASIITAVSYASTRGVDKEEGAVQRILNSRRISSIKEYILNVGHLPSAIVLNWTKDNIAERNGKLTISIEEKSAQLIDGQHRIAGLRAAINENRDIEKLEIPVSIYIKLSTKKCADIFLSINTEQKPVPRSLVYDLYGIADENVIDQAAARARDIATALNEDEDSPYRELIKFPGSPVRKGGIALSTAVSALKPLVEDKGDLEQRGIIELEMQKKVIINWFKVLQKAYGERWFENTNAFMYASGFSGAINFLRTRLLTACQDRKSFTAKTMESCFNFDRSDLILQEEVKGKGGKEAPLEVEQRLMGFFNMAGSTEDQFEI